MAVRRSTAATDTAATQVHGSGYATPPGSGRGNSLADTPQPYIHLPL